MHRTIDRLASLRVRDVMTRHVLTVSAEHSVPAVAAVFLANEISFAPVVDGQGKCVGVISAGDFLKRCSDEPEQQSVCAIMSAQVLSIAPDELLLRAAQVMCARHVHRLPVMGPDRQVEGVISTMDIASAMVNAIDEAEAARFSVRDF